MLNMEWLVAVITISAAVVTIVWFVRDIRKENSKVLKAILNAEKGQTEILVRHSEILARIEEGQRKGFLALEEGLRKMEEGQRKGFLALEEGQRKGFETLAQLLVKVGAR